MADAQVAAPAPASPKAKKVKKVAAKAKAPASHPSYGDMVRRAIADLKEKKGSSRAAILKYILQHFKVGGNIIQVNARIRLALKNGVKSGALKQVKGTGASGSFRIGEKAVKAKKPKAAKKPKSPKKTKKPKAAGAAKKPKSPKKAKKASPKKAASPKKVKASKPKKTKAPKKSSPKKKATKKAPKAAAPAVTA